MNVNRYAYTAERGWKIGGSNIFECQGELVKIDEGWNVSIVHTGPRPMIVIDH